MFLRASTWITFCCSGLPFLLAAQQTAPQELLAEQVFKDVRVFRGVPAKDMIPAMEFMSASLKVKCTYCHEKDDYAAETPGKATGRDMVILQRGINEKYFEGRLSVTCMTCHNGLEHPVTTPVPAEAKLKHRRIQTKVKPEELFKKHLTTIGTEPVAMTFVGTLSTPAEEEGGKDTVSPAELIQAKGGKFRMTSGVGKFGSDGTQVWKDGYPMTDEPAAIFTRLGRSWRGENAFSGLDNLFVSGQEVVGKTTTTVVRGTRKTTGSTEEFYFDDKTGLLVRFVNMTPSTIGTVLTVIDYSNFKTVSGVRVPMRVETTFAGGEKWTATYKTASTSDKVDEKTFTIDGK